MDYGAGVRDPLFFVGAVVDTRDGRREGRVKIRAFGIHGTPNEGVEDRNLPWAIVVTGDYKAASALNLSINQWVFGMFMDGRHAQQPVVLGLIPSQYLDRINPEENGWGVIPTSAGGGDADLTAKSTKPENIGEPDMPREARGENLEETAVFDMSMGRVRNVKVGGSESTWDEPAPAYAAQYPHNKVISTGVHTVELDETPGAERILVYHKSGSYVQMDTRGTTTEKSASDKFEVIDRAQHVFVGNASTVTINGNAHVYVKGNKTEEIQGDYKQIVHGNYYLGVGGPETIINGSANLQLRAGQVKIESNAGYMSLLSKKETQIQAGEGIQIQAPKIFNYSSDQYLVKSDNLFSVEATEDYKVLAKNIFQEGSENINYKAGADILLTADTGGGQISVKAKTVAIDENVTMANGDSGSAEGSSSVSRPGGMGESAAKVEAPEPPEQGTNVNTSPDRGSMSTTGAASQDSAGSVERRNDALTTAALRSPVSPLLDYIARFESRGLYDIRNGGSIHPSGLTNKTVGEIYEIQLRQRDALNNRNGQVRWPRSTSSAIGRYQFIYTTLQERVRAAGLSTGDLFNEYNQDLLGVESLRKKGLDSYLDGKINEYQFANKLAAEWAALPFVSGNQRGRGQYDGDSAGNQAATEEEGFSIQEYLNIIRDVKRNYDVSKQVEDLPNSINGAIST